MKAFYVILSISSLVLVSKSQRTKDNSFPTQELTIPQIFARLMSNSSNSSLYFHAVPTNYYNSTTLWPTEEKVVDLFNLTGLNGHEIPVVLAFPRLLENASQVKTESDVNASDFSPRILRISNRDQIQLSLLNPLSWLQTLPLLKIPIPPPTTTKAPEYQDTYVHYDQTTPKTYPEPTTPPVAYTPAPVAYPTTVPYPTEKPYGMPNAYPEPVYTHPPVTTPAPAPVYYPTQAPYGQVYEQPAQPEYSAYTPAPPAYTPAPPAYPQMPPAYTPAPPAYPQEPPAYTQAPPVYAEPPVYNHPPVYDQEQVYVPMSPAQPEAPAYQPPVYSPEAAYVPAMAPKPEYPSSEYVPAVADHHY